MRVLWIALGVFGISTYVFLALAENLAVYTIHITSSTDLEVAKKHTKHISRIIPLPVRLERIDHDYVVLAGISIDSSNLTPYLETVKESGYPQASLQTTTYAIERIILEIAPSIEIERNDQPHLSELTQKEQLGTGKVRLSDIEKEQPSKPSFVFGGKYYIGKAWQYYKDESYKQAIEFFTFAEKFPEMELEVKYGMAHCYVKQGTSEKAIPLFEELVKKKFKLDDTLPNLLRAKLASLSPSSPLVRELVEEILTINPGDISALTALAWWYYHKKQYNMAYDEFSKLYKKHPKSKDYAGKRSR